MLYLQNLWSTFAWFFRHYIQFVRGVHFKSQAHYSNPRLANWLAFKYSRTSVMWTPKGRTKGVHNSEVSTLVKLGVATGHIADHKQDYIGKTKRAGRKVSTVVGCPQ